MYNRKGISPVIATALIMVVAVVAVVGFQGWFGAFSNSMFTKVETRTNQASGDGTLSIETLIGNTLYVKNNITNNLSINSLKIGGVICNITENLSIGINEINVIACISNLTINTHNIVLITNTKVLDKQVYLKEITPLIPIIYSICTLDSLNVSHDSSAIFYNSTIGSICYSQTRTCNDGILNGSSNYNKSTCQILINGALTCSTDLDGDGYINSSCAYYPTTNITLSAHLDTNDNNNTIHPDMSCIFKGNKNSTSCIANFIVDGCGTGTVLDISTGYCWQKNMSSSGAMNWSNAKIYCNTTLNGLGGRNNWRLPTTQEMISIMDYKTGTVVGGSTKFTDTVGTYYWSSSTHNTVNVWVLSFGSGVGTTSASLGSNRQVVCVNKGS